MSSRGLSWILLCLLPAAGSFAQPEEPPPGLEAAPVGQLREPVVPRDYVIRRVRSVGGLPVQGMEDGAFYTPPLGDDCRLSSVPEPVVLASRLGSPLSLEVSVAACRQQLAAPRVDCRWSRIPIEPQYAGGALIGFAGSASCGEIGSPPRSGNRSWTGWSGTIELPPVSETGTYLLSLSCEIQGQGSEPEIRAPLFVTYSEPLTVVSPPTTSWYARAACWAAGLGADAGEEDVLRAIQSGLYRYGRAMWRYGYASEEGTDGSYLFPLSEGTGGGSEIHYTIEDDVLRPTCSSSDRCKCRWQGLVGLESPCDFADCYRFSETLQAMAAVMGVGGLRYIAISGEGQLGFLTEPAQSIDPKFTGSVACLGEEECYPYFFSTHSLRLRDEIYYDATFDRIYDHPAEPVALSKKHSTNDLVAFFASARILYSAGNRYGNWTFYADPPAATSAGSPEHSEGKIRFTDRVTFAAVDEDDNGVYDYLQAEVEVEVGSPGTYLIHGGVNKGEVTVTHRPSWWSSQPTVAVLTAKPGLHKVELHFSGEEILQAALDGPYDFFALVHADDYDLEILEEPTPAYSFQDFGELDAALQDGIETRGVDADGDGRFEALEISIPFDVQAAGTFAIEARLAKDGVTLAYAGEKQHFDVGETTVELMIPGERIAASGLDSPYQLTVLYYDPYLSAQQDIQEVVLGFEARDFE